MRSNQAWPEMTVASPEQRESGMGVIEIGPEAGLVEEARGRIYAFLGALFSHPDMGKWGRVLNADEQRLAIATADVLRARACGMKYLVLADELPGSELDLRFLVVELCQPLEHLKAEYERVLCVRRPRPGCSPFALDHQKEITGFLLAESLANLAGVYRAFGFAQGNKLPLRTDHIAYVLVFMSWLISQRRLVSRMALFDRQAAEQATRCDLAQRSFFSDHLAGWAGPLSAGLQKYTGGGYFEPLGRFLAAWIPLERYFLNAEPPCEEIHGSREEAPVGS
ncbi:MAG: TorD/DmsD family molecular chaperone [Isosphaeraceae bacterium]